MKYVGTQTASIKRPASFDFVMMNDVVLPLIAFIGDQVVAWSRVMIQADYLAIIRRMTSTISRSRDLTLLLDESEYLGIGTRADLDRVRTMNMM